MILQASLRESWLDDMMHVLEGEALGQDAATVEAAFKRHEAISTDVKARVNVSFATAHMFCVSGDTQVPYEWCLLVQGYFCAV